jgi:hypothetical protein
MSSQQQLACNAQQILQWACRTAKTDSGAQSLLMSVLVAQFAQLANMSISCEALEAAAAQYGCLSRQAQLPALIYLVTQITATVPPDYIDYPGPPTVNPPALQNIVVDVNGQQWQFFNNAWS